MTGLLDIPASRYHADEIGGDRPSLSKSILHILLERSPAHAFAAHPKLNPAFQPQDDAKFELGTAAHSLFLEGIDGVAVLPYANYKTKAAQEERDEARANGRIPMLPDQYERCVEMVESLRDQCDAHPAGPFFPEGGECEKTLVWTDDYGVLCRARLDWLADDHSAIHDLKSTSASANPEAWSRTLFGIGAHLQVALYLRGCRAVLGCEPEFRFIVVETQPPYAMSVVSLAPDALALADKQVDYGMRLWAKCLRNEHWPAYPSEVAYAQAPPWLEAAWLARELREISA